MTGSANDPSLRTEIFRQYAMDEMSTKVQFILALEYAVRVTNADVDILYDCHTFFVCCFLLFFFLTMKLFSVQYIRNCKNYYIKLYIIASLEIAGLNETKRKKKN